MLLVLPVLSALDIVVVAQKVKVVNEDQSDLKKWVGGGGVSLIGRDSY